MGGGLLVSEFMWGIVGLINSEITQIDDIEIRMLIEASCGKCVFITSLKHSKFNMKRSCK